MTHGKCERCGAPLIEIDDHGTLLRGCLACNSWRSLDGLRIVKLSDENVEAFRQMRDR